VKDKKLEKYCDVISDAIVSNTFFDGIFSTSLFFSPPYFDGASVSWDIWDEFFSKDYEGHLINGSVGLDMIKDYIKEYYSLSDEQSQKMMPYIYRKVSEDTIKKSKKYSEK
jgi:hypothetical protein